MSTAFGAPLVNAGGGGTGRSTGGASLADAAPGDVTGAAGPGAATFRGDRGAPRPTPGETVAEAAAGAIAAAGVCSAETGRAAAAVETLVAGSGRAGGRAPRSRISNRVMLTAATAIAAAAMAVRVYLDGGFTTAVSSA